ADEEILIQFTDLGRRFLKVMLIVGERRRTAYNHAAADAPEDGTLLILAEVGLRAAFQQSEDPLELALTFRKNLLMHSLRSRGNYIRMAADSGEFPGDIGRWKD